MIGVVSALGVMVMTGVGPGLPIPSEAFGQHVAQIAQAYGDRRRTKIGGVVAAPIAARGLRRTLMTTCSLKAHNPGAGPLSRATGGKGSHLDFSASHPLNPERIDRMMLLPGFPGGRIP